MCKNAVYLHFIDKVSKILFIEENNKFSKGILIYLVLIFWNIYWIKCSILERADFIETESENFYKKKLRKILESFDV